MHAPEGDSLHVCWIRAQVEVTAKGLPPSVSQAIRLVSSQTLSTTLGNGRWATPRALAISTIQHALEAEGQALGESGLLRPLFLLQTLFWQLLQAC